VATADLLQVVRQARDEAKAILTGLETAGHPQTSESSSLYLALVTIQKRLAQGGAAVVGDFRGELEQLKTLCVGKLEPLKAQLEEALRIARSGSQRRG
jgi:hypothetical protein